MSTPRSHRSRRGLIFAGGVLAAAGVVYVGLATGGSDQVPDKTTVLGKDISGKSEQEAAAYLRRHLGKSASAPLRITVADLSVEVNPQQAGLRFDPAATVSTVTGARWNPSSLMERFVGSTEVEPAVVVDESRVRALVAGLATEVDVLPVNADVIIRDGEPVLERGEAGKRIDQEAAVTAIVDSYLRTRKPVTLPVVTVQPAVSDQEAQRVIDTVATPALAEPILFRAKSKLGAVSGKYDIGSVLSFEPNGSTLKPVIDAEELHQIMRSEFGKVEQPGRDATFVIRKNKPVLVASKVGFGIDTTRLAASVEAILTRKGSERVVNTRMSELLPEFSTEAVKALGIKEEIGSYTQEFPYAAYRVQNIGTAAERVNGTLLLPGEEFSMNDTIGERTVENGYTKGYVVGDGGVLKMDEGGGVSTATTAVYNAAWFSGLEFVQHKAHSIWIKRYKPGREATVSWGDFDMKFRNNTPHGVFITTEMGDEYIKVRMWGTREWQKIGSVFGEFTDKQPFGTVYNTDKECQATLGQEGFQIDVDRTFYRGGKVAKSERYHTTYKPTPRVICGPEPKPEPPPEQPSDPPSEPPASPAASPSAKPTSNG